MPGDALTTDGAKMDTSDYLWFFFVSFVSLMLILFGTVLYTQKTEIDGMKSEIAALKTAINLVSAPMLTSDGFPEGYSEPFAWYPATDPAGPDEQPTIEQPEIVNHTTKTVELQERIADPYIQALHGGK